MNKSIPTLLLASALILPLTGCVVAVGGDRDHDGKYSWSHDYEDREYENRKKIGKLQVGMSIVDVQEKLGVADFNEVYEKDGQPAQALFYRTHRKHEDGMTTKDECTILIFANGELKTWRMYDNSLNTQELVYSYM